MPALFVCNTMTFIDAPCNHDICNSNDRPCQYPEHSTSVLKEILLHDDFDVGGFVDRQQTLNMD